MIHIRTILTPADGQSAALNPDKADNNMGFMIPWISSPCILHHGLPLLRSPTFILLLNITTFSTIVTLINGQLCVSWVIIPFSPLAVEAKLS